MGLMEEEGLLRSIGCFLLLLMIGLTSPAQEIKTESTDEELHKTEELLQSFQKPDETKAGEVIKRFAGPSNKSAKELINELRPGTFGATENPDEKSKNTGKLFYFFSFSMPQGGLKSLLPEIEKAGVVMVLRGMNEDLGLRGTMLKIADLLKRTDDQSYEVEVWIHPVFFRCFGVQSVPEIVYVSEGNPEECSEDYVKVRGDVSISHALYLIAKEDEGAERYLKILEEGFYDKKN